VLHPHLFQVHLEFFGDQHGDRGICALSHFDLGHGQHDLTIAFDANERVGREAARFGRFGRNACSGQAQTQHEPPARGRSGLQESPPGKTVR
jgi:hypothetical protein